MVGANIGVSMPVYWLGLMLAYLFALVLKIRLFGCLHQDGYPRVYRLFLFMKCLNWDLVEGTIRYNFAEFISNLYILNSIITRDWVVSR